MKKNITMPVYWGILHGFNDWLAGYMLARFTITGTRQESFSALIIYSAIAFAGQLPIGLWIDKTENLKLPVKISFILLPAAILLFPLNPFLAILIAGVASAGIHVSGGCISFFVAEGKISPLGIFTAPGVAGLALGGFCINMPSGFLWVLLIPVGINIYLIIKEGIPPYSSICKKNKAAIDSHDMVMLLVLLIMVMRSFLFDLLNNYSAHFEYGLLITGLSAFAGKLICGLLADRIGWRRWLFITLPLAFIFLEIGRENVYAFAFGVACMQSSVPVTLALVYRSIPQYPAAAAAFGLGVCVALAGLPLYGMPGLHSVFSDSHVFFGLGIAGVFILIAGLLLLIRVIKSGALLLK